MVAQMMGYKVSYIYPFYICPFGSSMVKSSTSLCFQVSFCELWSHTELTRELSPAEHCRQQERQGHSVSGYERQPDADKEHERVR